MDFPIQDLKLWLHRQFQKWDVDRIQISSFVKHYLNAFTAVYIDFMPVIKQL